MLHVLDIAMNAVSAGARTVKISIDEQPLRDCLMLLVADNGPGMSAEMVSAVRERFATTKTKKSGWVGFGIALLQGTADLVGGEVALLSRVGRGTLVKTCLPFAHPDRPPLGAVAESLQPLFVGCVGVDVCFTHRVGEQTYRLDTRPVRRALGAAYSTRSVQSWLLTRIREGEATLAARGEGGHEPG